MCSSDLSRSGSGTVIVPNLQGRTIKEAGYILEMVGLRPVPEGSGVAIRQSYNPGAAVKRDTPVRVVFEPPGGSLETAPPAVVVEPQTPEIINSPDIH